MTDLRAQLAQAIHKIVRRRITTTYRVFYQVRSEGEIETRMDGEQFTTRREALEHRNWVIGHYRMFLACWVEKHTTDHQCLGKVLRRYEHSGPVQ